MTDLFFRTCALTFGVYQGQNLFDHLGVRLSAVLHGDRVVAFGAVADVFDVRLCARPPHAVHLLARVTCGLRFFQSGRIHHTPAPQQNIVGPSLTNLQPGGFLLNTWRGHWQQLQREAMHGSALLQQGNRLFAIWRVVVDQGDFFAFEFVQATFFFTNRLNQHVSGQPIGACQWEVPFENGAVLAFAAAIAGSDQGNFVTGCFFSQCKRNASGQRLEHRCAAVLALQTLITLHTPCGVVAGFALLINDLHAVDAALGIDQLEVV